MAKMALGYMETQLAKWTDEPIESLNEIQTNVCLNSLNSFIKQIKVFPPCDAEYKINKLKLYVKNLCPSVHLFSRPDPETKSII